MTKDNPFTQHHIIPRSRGGTNDTQNLVLIREHRHRALHTLFEHALPHEQLIDIVSLSDTTLKGRFRTEILKILDHDPRDIYERACWKKESGILIRKSSL